MPRLHYKTCVKDMGVAGVLAAAGACAGFMLNAFRDAPLPLVYVSKAERVQLAVARISQAGVDANISDPVQTLDIAAFQAIVEKKQGVVLDARAEIFHRLGHVPGALSLPREDFENAYKEHCALLEKNKNQRITVYCSGSDCEDSQMVADALAKLGYTHIAIFEGGWNAWTEAHLPEEKAQ